MGYITKTLLHNTKNIFSFQHERMTYFSLCSCRVYERRTKVTFQNKFRFARNSKESSLHDEDMRKSATVSSLEFNYQSRHHGSKHNKLKKSQNLHCKGEILYGIHPVYLALKEQKRQFYQLLLKHERSSEFGGNSRAAKIEKITDLASSLGIEIKRVRVREMNNLTSNAVHQGVCLDASELPALEYQETINDCINSGPPYPLWLVLNEIQDPMNVGAILRSGYFFGVEKIFILKNNSCKLSPVVSKASAGAMELMSIFRIGDLQCFLQRTKSHGFSLVSTMCNINPSVGHNYLSSPMELHNFIVKKPTVLLLGNEGTGLEPTIQNMCDIALSISPKKTMYPGIDSLNVSVATGIMLHHMTNSWRAIK